MSRLVIPFAVTLGYLGAIGWFLGKQVTGDPRMTPASYLFTWDMFPSYATEYARRYAIGTSETGEQFLVYPGVSDQARVGATGDFPRMDMVPVLAGRLKAAMQKSIERNISLHERAGGSKVTRVQIFEEWTPASFHRDPNQIPDRRDWKVRALAVREGDGFRWVDLPE